VALAVYFYQSLGDQGIGANLMQILEKELGEIEDVEVLKSLNEEGGEISEARELELAGGGCGLRILHLHESLVRVNY